MPWTLNQPVSKQILRSLARARPLLVTEDKLPPSSPTSLKPRIISGSVISVSRHKKPKERQGRKAFESPGEGGGRGGPAGNPELSTAVFGEGLVPLPL